ncbi:hypothetical protein [Leclercia sp.]|uniref:hypothetical protein n=1 Tax=Leclercia sp. TaxID=1898428 RepID=UPI002899B4B2|nr:hypothetical protein [Leclercia sp.]
MTVPGDVCIAGLFLPQPVDGDHKILPLKCELDHLKFPQVVIGLTFSTADCANRSFPFA